MNDPIPPNRFDFTKWYSEQYAKAAGDAEALGEREANDKWSAGDYAKAHLDNYLRQKEYAEGMTRKTGKAWIASASGSVEPAGALLGDKVGDYLV